MHYSYIQAGGLIFAVLRMAYIIVIVAKFIVTRIMAHWNVALFVWNPIRWRPLFLIKPWRCNSMPNIRWVLVIKFWPIYIYMLVAPFLSFLSVCKTFQLRNYVIDTSSMSYMINLWVLYKASVGKDVNPDG